MRAVRVGATGGTAPTVGASGGSPTPVAVASPEAVVPVAASVSAPAVGVVDPVGVVVEGVSEAAVRVRGGMLALGGGVTGLLEVALEWGPVGVRALFGREVVWLHPAIAESAGRFLARYGEYADAVEAALVKGGDGAVAAVGFGAHTRWRRRVSARFGGRYAQAMAAADAHVAQVRERLGRVVGRYLLVKKSEFVVYLVGERNEALAVFPVGVAVKRGQKARRGDLKTPEGPVGRWERDATPFFVGPLYRGDVVPDGGVIARAIGVDSGEREFGFLERGWLIMFHGTPDGGSLGARSSLGCFRMLPRHIEVLFEYVRAGMPVVVEP